MRPHNKSTLWDEYLEHYDKQKKYFNTKHKNAFCKRCISYAMTQLDASPSALAAFEATDFVEGWDEWKCRQAFEKVEPISGRSSNMQRHIRICQHIPASERARIMMNFEASRSQTKIMEHNEPSDERARASACALSWQPQLPAEQPNSDEDAATSTSSVPSPPLGGPFSLGRQYGADILEPVQRPCSRLTLRSILNDDDTNPPTSTKSPNGATQSRYIGMAGSINSAAAESALIARLDSALEELQQVRTHLRSTTTDSMAMIARLESEMLAIRRENEWLKRRNEELRGRLHQQPKGLTSDPGEDIGISPSTPRASSAPVLVEVEKLKKRKLSAENCETFPVS